MRHRSARHGATEAIQGVRRCDVGSMEDSRYPDGPRRSYSSEAAPHRNGGNRLPCRPRDMKDIDKTSNLKANDFTRCIDERKQAFSPHELTSARKQECQARRIDKANSLTVDDNTTHAAANQNIQPPTQRRHRGDVDIAWWRQNRYVIPLIHTTMVPKKPTRCIRFPNRTDSARPASSMNDPVKTQGTPMQCHRPAPIR